LRRANCRRRVRINSGGDSIAQSMAARGTERRSTACSTPATISSRHEMFSPRPSNTGRGSG
jgi:hypothetical protein